MTTQEILRILLLLSPVFLIQLVLAIYALLDLRKRTVVHGPRWVWATGLLLTILAVPTGILLSAVYLAWGRNVEG